MKLNLSLKTRIFFVIASLVFISSSIICLSGYKCASKALLDEVRSKLSSIAANTATHIDVNQYNRIRDINSETSADYLAIHEMLSKVIKADPSIQNAYTMRPTKSANKWIFIVDGTDKADEVAHVGEEYDSSDCPMMKEALSTPTADLEVSSDRWGTWLSGYAPIKGENGKVEGIVGIDMSVNQLAKELISLKIAAIQNILLSLLLTFIVSSLLTKALLKPINKFIYAANQVSEGNLEVRVNENSCKEVTQISNVFNNMVVGLKESRERLLEATSKDVLTGVYSHMYYHERIALEIDRAKRYGSQLSLLVMDLDRFKVMNDTLGHIIGDSLLRQLAIVIKDNLRSTDIICRYGGDEFAIILTETNAESAFIVAENIRKVIENHDFYALSINEMPGDFINTNESKKINLTVTIGCASFSDSNSSKDGLFMAADIALCKAKHISRNSVCVFDQFVDGEDKIDPQDIYTAIHDPNSAAVKSLAAAVDAKDQYTKGHSDRVAEYAFDLGIAIKCDAELQNALGVAGLLHDLGKIGVPDEIFSKHGSLTTDERQVVQQHPNIGGNILKRAPQLETIMPAVLYHHERWDGKGYPEGLKGEQIPLIARIMGVADAFDAMTSDRAYRKAMTVEAALIELRNGAGKQFDPKLVESFINYYASQNKKAA